MTANAPINTVNELFGRVSTAASPRAMLWQDASGQWQPISSDQVYHRARALAEAFLAWGAKKGDRIALIGENRWEWAITDFATLAIGAVDVPVYPTLTGEQIAVLMRDAGCRIAVVSTRQQFDKLNAVRGQTELERIVIMDSADPPEGAIPFSRIMDGADDRANWQDSAFDKRVQSIGPNDLATLIYTSGTTGEPKGVSLTHGNIAINTSLATREFGFGPKDVCISFLPLSHITARALDYAMFYYGAQVAYCSHFDKLPEAMRQVKPSVFVGVPRVYEKIRQAVEQKSAASPVKKRILGWAVGVGAQHRDAVYDGRRPAALGWKLADKLVYSKVAEAFGGRVRTFISGGAPLGIDTARWFAAAGIPLYEGYGLTETSPVIAVNSPVTHRMGSVGRPLPNVECMLAEDGELLVRGPSIFKGYWHKPEANAECFNAEGWFHTGDIAHIDEDGFIYITDRKKELLKTSGGKLVAPQPIESKFKTNLLVAQAALVGDRHKFISALLAPNFAALEEWARQQGIQARSRSELVNDSRVVAHYSEIVRQVNSGLANFETVKRFRLVHDEWTLEGGHLTPSMKLKRREITSRYAELIAALYEDEATAHAE
ncbi:MAG: long-chain fatty acid--CoA ligase [Terracidiphilus sp.]